MAFKTFKPTKADQMRAFIAQAKAEGKTVRPKDIMDAMAAQGITTSSGQASLVLKKFNQRRRNGRLRAAAREGVGRNTGRQSTCALNGKRSNNSFADLAAAATFAEQCGGVEAAKKAITELARIVDLFGHS